MHSHIHVCAHVYIHVHIHVYENMRKKIKFSIYGFIMTESPLKQIGFSSNAVTVCNMFLFRLFVRRFCYYCPSLVLTNAGLTPNDFHSHRVCIASFWKLSC